MAMDCLRGGMDRGTGEVDHLSLFMLPNANTQRMTFLTG
jgi:hypothetical protein